MSREPTQSVPGSCLGSAPHTMSQAWPGLFWTFPTADPGRGYFRTGITVI